MASTLRGFSPFIFAGRNIFREHVNFKHFFSTSTSGIPKSTINAEELKKFDTKSDQWWESLYEVLHLSNSVRVPFIRDGILFIAKRYEKVAKPLVGYNILDVGCGGGILSEPLARLGAKVTGLDPGENNIKVAIEHALKDPEIKDNLSYVCDTVENLSMADNKFDAVVASEVIEHVDNVPTFVQSCVELTKKNGSLFFTTMNQTNMSYILSILMAEYALRLIPIGTHDWNKFVKPEDLIQILESLNCRIVSLEGVVYNPFTKNFSWTSNTQNQYSLHAVKL